MTLWERRDFPVLRALVEKKDADENLRHGFVGLDGAAETLDLDLLNDEIHEAILALGDVGYVEYEFNAESGFGGFFTHVKVTGRGYQLLGEWPYFTEMTPATLATLLERFADKAATEEEATNARKAASFIRTLSGTAVKAALRVAMVEGFKMAAGLPH